MAELVSYKCKNHTCFTKFPKVNNVQLSPFLFAELRLEKEKGCFSKLVTEAFHVTGDI